LVVEIQEKKKQKGYEMVNEEINQLAKKLKAEYQKSWRNNNKDRVKQHNISYWQQKAEKEISKRKGK